MGRQRQGHRNKSLKTEAKKGQQIPLCPQTSRKSSVLWERAESSVKHRPPQLLQETKEKAPVAMHSLPTARARPLLRYLEGMHDVYYTEGNLTTDPLPLKPNQGPSSLDHDKRSS